MENIRETLRSGFKNPLALVGLGVILGIILGLIWGYWIDPVEYTDAAITHLRDDLKIDYLRMAIDSYALNQDVGAAEQRYDRLGEDAGEFLEIIELNPGNQLISDISSFKAAVEMTSPFEEIEEEEPVESSEGAGGNILRWALLATILLALALVGRYFLVRRSDAGSKEYQKSAASMAQEITSKIDTTDFGESGESPPMHQFVTTYVLGDNLFDDSFSIESAAGEFLGECGVGISEVIGVGEPKRVTAFEVWLFDQNDIKTVTKVLMSGHAYYDDGVRSELEKKGEPILAEPGKEFSLTTNNLMIVGRVMDMGYGEGPLPEESFFDRLSIELSVWPNDGIGDPEPFDFDEF